MQQKVLKLMTFAGVEACQKLAWRCIFVFMTLGGDFSLPLHVCHQQDFSIFILAGAFLTVYYV